MLPRVDCEAIRRAEERAYNSIVRFEVQFNVVVNDIYYIFIHVYLYLYTFILIYTHTFTYVNMYIYLNYKTK